MREVFFWGQRVDNDEWTEGYLFKHWNRTFILWGMTGDVPNMVEVKPETVRQFIGLARGRRHRMRRNNRQHLRQQRNLGE